MSLERSDVTKLSAPPAAGSEDFIAIAAHELRAPATVIGAAAETLQRLVDPAMLDPRASELLAMIIRNARQLRRLSVDILSAVYLERGDLSPTMASLPLLPIIRWAVDAGQVAESAVRIECDPALMASVDADQLERILTNLVANAFEHGAPPVEVSARAGVNGDGPTIAVRDFGLGVPDHAEELFDRFSPLALHTPTSTGLGLSISRGLARAMSGDLTYQRAEPGSVFLVTLAAA